MKKNRFASASSPKRSSFSSQQGKGGKPQRAGGRGRGDSFRGERDARFEDKKASDQKGSFEKKGGLKKGPPSKTPFRKKEDGEKSATFSRSASFRPAAKSLRIVPRGQLLWGAHAVREAWLNPERRCLALWVSGSGMEALESVFALADKEKLSRPPVTLVEKAEIDALLPKGAVHQGIALEAEPLPERSIDDLLGQDRAPRLVVILDQVTDPHNVGAILRSAAAFGAGAVIVTERNAPGATGLMAKTACGAVEHVPLIPVVNLARALEALKAESYWCVGLAEEGEKELSACRLAPGKIALVLGAEGNGLRRLTRAHCDELARLPTGGAIGSLNVSNAAAVALYEAKQQEKNKTTAF